MKINWKAVGFGLVCAVAGAVTSWPFAREYGSHRAIDTVFEFCYNGNGVIVDENTGRAVACLGIRQTEQERLEQKKFEQSLDKRNEA